MYYPSDHQYVSRDYFRSLQFTDKLLWMWVVLVDFIRQRPPYAPGELSACGTSVRLTDAEYEYNRIISKKYSGVTMPSLEEMDAKLEEKRQQRLASNHR